MQKLVKVIRKQTIAQSAKVLALHPQFRVRQGCKECRK